MLIHRRVSIRMWNDAGFRNLSPLPPSGQSLWLYLLTCELALPWPGIIAHGLGTISERRRWPVAETETAWREIEEQGMAYGDWTGPLIWLPNAVMHNEPSNPNQAKAWGRCSEHLPECRLLTSAREATEGYLTTRTDGFLEAFREGWREGFGNRSGNHSANGSGNQ